jgi:predicted NAD/FAD-dependent oxidoreductase
VSRQVAIVGAGVAGCAVAYGLRDLDADATVFERRTEAGGRAATRSRDGCVYDVGANYLTPEGERIRELVAGPLADDLVAVDGDVWTVDADGAIAPGRDGNDPKLTGRRGLAVLGERLLERSDAAVRYDTDVAGLDRLGPDDGWSVRIGSPLGDDRSRAGPFDAVVLTPPAPATAELLLDVSVADSLRRAARSISYRSITTVACRYDRALEWPYYALVDTSKSRDLGWVAREECKPGHVPDGDSLVIVQGSPELSERYREATDDAVADDAADRLAALVDDPGLAEPVWTDVVHWKYALTDDGIPEGPRRDPAAAGLHVAGDWVAGEARLHAAIGSGLDVATRLAERA